MVDACVPIGKGQRENYIYGSSLGIDPLDERLGEIFLVRGKTSGKLISWNPWSKVP